MKVTLTVIIGDPMDPLGGFSREDFIYGDTPDVGREQLAAFEQALNFIDDAKASVERQAQAVQSAFGQGPG